MVQATRRSWLWGVLVAVALVATARGQSGVVLSPAVAPSAAQPGVHTVTVTGSGFPAGAIPPANVTVTLVPASGTGTSATTPATGVQLLFTGTRRVSFQIPTTIAVTTPTAYRVSIAGTTGAGTAFSSTAPVTFTVNPPSQIVSLTPASPAKGATTAVQMVTQYTDFAAGVTVASFGAGASVGGGPEGGFGPITVTSATTATALVAMNANAAAGARAVTVATGVQTATLAQGVTVAETAVANQPPHIASAPGTAATVLQPYTYQATATDADNDTLTWALTVAPSGMTIAQATGAVAWTPPAALAGTHAVTVQVTDGKGGLDTQSYSIVVAAARVNQAPHITSTPGTAATAGQAYTYAPAATDADGDTLMWTLPQSPAGMAVTPGTGAIAWTPATGQVGAQTVTLSVSDGHGGTDSQTFAVTVARPPNQAPRITSSAVTAGRASEAYAYAVTATDPDSDPLTFTLTTAPAGMTIGVATGAVSWTPAAQHAGSQSVTVRVNDGRGGSDTQSFSITVLPAANQAPTARIAGPATGIVSQSLAFDASTSTDPDADALSFSWSFGDGATATGASATHGYATSGTFTVTLTANDGHGHTPTATRSVVVNPPSNRAPAAVAGGPYSGETGIPVTFSGTGSGDPDGDVLTYSWSFGDQAIGTGASPSHAYATVGTYAVTLTVTDSHQTTSSATTSVTVAAAADRAPPLVTLTAPRQALPGATVTITVGASDNDRVSSVVLTVEGDTPTTFTAGPYSRTYTLPAIAAPGSLIHLSASAIDPSSNTGQATATITVAAQPDTEPPTATLTAPAQAAPGTTVTLSADAHDNVGVAGVAFTVGGAPIGTVSAPPYVTTWTVPSNATAGTVYPLLATASDAGGLTGAASASLTVVAAAPASADPSVTLTVPATVPAGGTVDLSAVAIADPTVVSVAFTVDGARLATIVTSPYATRYTVPPGLRNGATLQVQAEVTDGLGRTARDTKATTVQAGAAPGMGVLYGRVFDDTTGLAIANATVTLVSTSVTATTDAQGRYTIGASEGPGTLRVTKNGWSRVDRPVTFVAGNTAFRVLDARLTPLAAAGAALPSVVGGAVSQSGWSFVVPGGALNADTAIALTSIGGQGLQGRLPLGWSPVATVDVAPHGAALAPAATLKAPAQASPSTRVLARWDETAAAWRAVATTAETTLEVPIVSTGQYSWLRADTTPAAPPVPSDGALLEGILPVAIPDVATTRVSPDPKILFYSPGVGSLVTGIVTSPSPLPSGTPLTLALNEVYHFLDATNASPERVTQDLAAYQSPAVPTEAQAVFPATPSLAFEAIALRDGVITAALYTQGAETGVPLLGAAGGVVNGPAGEQLEIPQGAAPASPMALTTLAQADAGMTLPQGTSWLAGVTFSFSGELALAGRLSVAKPSGLADASQVLLVRVRESNGQTHFLLAARARLEGDRLVADTSLPGSSDVLEAVRLPGRYVFIQTTDPLAFSVGAVSGVSGAPFAGALVTNDRLAIGALSTATGRYAQAMPGGAVTLTALDEVKRDTGTASNAVVAGLTSTIDLALLAQPPAVASITPADGATSVALSDPIIVRFSEPVAPGTVTALAVLLTGPSGPVTSSLTLTSNNTVATLRPVSALDANTAYTVTIDNNITDLAGYALPAKVTAHFTSVNTTPPTAPPAGNLSATIPSGGTTIVSGTQGSAGLHDTVTIVNVTQRTSAPALVDPNGGFTATVAAAATDELRVEIADQAGNKTTVALPAFRQVNPDGSVSQVIGKNGGHMEGPNGIALDAIADTFPRGAVVTIKPVTEADFPAKLTPEQAQVFSYTAGLTLDFGGATPQHYLNVSVPAGPADKVDDRWVVSQVIQVDGQAVMNAVDTAKLIDGRVATSSPPCPGVLAAGMYGIHKSAKMMAVVYGSGAMRQTADVYRAIASQSLGVGGSSDGVSMAVPAGAYFDSTFDFCLPIMTSRITLTRNTVDILVQADRIKAEFRQIKVTNAAPDRGGTWSFSRDEFYIGVRVTAADGTINRAEAGYADGSRSTLSYVTAALPGGDTLVRIGLEAFPAAATGLVLSLNGASGPATKLVPRIDLAVPFRVQGGTADTYDVKWVSRNGTEQPLPGCPIQASSLGAGPLVVRALPGTIDPTHAEVDAYNAEVAAWNAAHPTEPPRVPIDSGGRYRTKVEVRHNIGTVETLVEVPQPSIVGGGFTFAFTGALTPADKYAVVVSYAPPVFQQEVIDLPVFTLKVSNAGNIVKVITLPSPPMDQPLKLPPLANDSIAPDLRGDFTQYTSFDPARFLSFLFTEAMDPASMRMFTLLDPSGTPVAGRVVVSEGNTRLTFVPAAPLKLATGYTASFVGLTDLAGNAITDPLHLSMTVTTATPRTAGTLTFPDNTPVASPVEPWASLLDLQFMTKVDAANVLRTYAIAVTSEISGFKLATIDVTDPTSPTFVAGGYGGYFKNRILLVPTLDFPLANLTERGDRKDGANFCQGPAPPLIGPVPTRFTGTLAITANANMTSSAVQFFDVTDPTKAPCMAGMKTLTANPEQYSSYTVTGTHHVLGFARASAYIQIQESPTKVAAMAYTAVQGAGLIATRIDRNIPEVDADKRQRDPMLPGDYSDVVAVGGDRLLAINMESGELHAVDPNLAIISMFFVSDPVTDPPMTMSVHEGVPWDANGDGTIAPGEFLNLAIVGTFKGVKVVDITQLDSMRIVASLSGLDKIRALELDPATRRLWVATAGMVYLVDLSGPARFGLVDADGDGKDDRIAWSRAAPDSPFGLRRDSRGYVYLATDKGLEVLTLAPPNLHGTARFTQIPVDPVVGLDFEHAQLRPVRRAKVLARNSAGVVIGKTFTDELGRYSLDVPKNTDLYVELWAGMGSASQNQLDIQVFKIEHSPGDPTAIPPVPPTTKAGDPHLLSVPIRTPPSGEMVVDLEATTDIEPGTRNYRAGGSRLGGAFNLLDTIYSGQQKILAVDPTMVFKPVMVLWTPEKMAKGGTTACDDTYCYINGVENVDTDEYDISVILHEYGHQILKSLKLSDSTAGNHENGDVLDPRTSFNEGFAYAFGNMLAGTPLNIDTKGPYKAPLGSNLENPTCTILGTSTPCANGPFDETTMIALIWDLFDGVSTVQAPDQDPSDDGVSLGLGEVWRVLTGPMREYSSGFVTIYPFVYHLMAPYKGSTPASPTWTAIEKLLNHWKVEVPNDPAGPNLYVDVPLGGTPVSTFPFGPPPSVSMGPKSGDPLGTRDDYGKPVWAAAPPPDGWEGNNKAYNRVFLRITVGPLDQGKYRLVVTRTPADVAVRVHVYEGRDSSAGSYNNVGSESDAAINVPVDLTKWMLLERNKTYLVEISTGPDSTNTDVGPATFTVRLVKQ